jgi:hypothetical protein
MDPEARSEDVPAYAAAVRAALGGLPPAQSEVLLDDLDDHLAEVAAESGEPLLSRLGPPERYAAELRSAYERGVARPARRTALVSRAWTHVRARIAASPAFRELRAFLPQLRPAWWVFRGYVLVLFLALLFNGGRIVRPIPSPFSARGLLQLIATVVAIVVSVRLGQRGKPGGRVLAAAALQANCLIALVAIPALASMGTNPGSTAEAGSPVVDQALSPVSPVTNIFPYSRDGRPLDDVLLYDQNGNPLTLASGGPDLITEFPAGADGQPIDNAYPLRQRHLNGDPVQRPRVAIPPWPPSSPSPTPTSSVSPTPAASAGR